MKGVPREEMLKGIERQFWKLNQLSCGATKNVCLAS